VFGNVVHRFLCDPESNDLQRLGYFTLLDSDLLFHANS
jgi:hypothetical protein